MKLRLRSLTIVYSAVIVVWVVYLFSVQILDPFELRDKRTGRYKPSKEIIIPRRGPIFDRNNELLVISQKIYQIDIDKAYIKNTYSRSKSNSPESVLLRIAEIIAHNTEKEKNEIVKRINSSRTSSVWLGADFRELEIEKIKTQLEEEKIKGVVISFTAMERLYPRDELAARILGKAASKADSNSTTSESIYSLDGVCGLEVVYDSYLKGKYGWRTCYYDANNKKIHTPEYNEEKVVDGSSVYLTLDARIQEIVESKLKYAIERYQAKNAIGLFMNTQTGEIYAMAGISSKNNKMTSSQIRGLPNLGVYYTYEPGSTLKPITSLVALENKLTRSDEKIDCRKYKLGKRTIKDAHELTFLTPKEVIAYSSNVGISKIAERIGKERLYNRLIEMGFGNRTGSGLAGEVSGTLNSLDKWQGYSLHSISFGQEITVTPLQLVNAYSTLANGGKVLKPQIISKVVDNEGNIIEQFEPIIMRTISNPEALDSLKSYLKAVVDFGTASSLKIPGISIGGKTGTAEKVEEGTGKYSENKYTASFVGFFPVENPLMTGIIILDEPAYQHRYGSSCAVPVFEEIVKEIIHLPEYDIMPELKEIAAKDDYITVPELIGLSWQEARKILEDNKIEYLLTNPLEEGIVLNQYPKANVYFDKCNKVNIILGTKEEAEKVIALDSTMPDFIGKTSRKAMQLAKQKKVKLVIEGVGRIAYQSIPAGSKIDYGEICKLKAE